MWNLRHSLWTIIHDVIAHPLCGLLWAINHPITNRAGYWLHDVTLPDAWWQDNDRRHIAG